MLMPSPLVSVIIPCHDAAAWLRETLDSVRTQEGVDVEVIVVDDGSTDDSASIAEAFGPPVSLVIRQPQSGASRARNVGTAESSGALVVYLDADDLLLPGTLAERCHVMDTAGASVVYTDWTEWVRQPDGTFKEGTTRTRELGSRPDLEIAVDAWWPPGALLYTRTVVDRALPWREDLPVIQDARFLFDAAAAGGTFCRSPHVGLRYRIHGTASLSRRNPRAFLEDCYRNITEIDTRWSAEGLDEAQQHALARCYAFLTRSFFRLDARRHDESLRRLLEIEPGYLPDGPADFRALVRVFGFSRAERLAALARPLKHAARQLLPSR